MSEYDGADVTKTQLHLRVGPELVERLDAARGAATRNAFAAMLLGLALAGVDAPGETAAPIERRTAARETRAPRRTEPRAEASEPAAVPLSVPDLGVALTVASALAKPAPKGNCPHKMPRGAYCKLCGAVA
jgi:hypothetical protein